MLWCAPEHARTRRVKKLERTIFSEFTSQPIVRILALQPTV